MTSPAFDGDGAVEISTQGTKAFIDLRRASGQCGTCESGVNAPFITQKSPKNAVRLSETRV